MKNGRMTSLLFLCLLAVSFSKPAAAAWPILNDPDMDRFVQTFPGMYREYKQLTLTINPAAGATQKAQLDQEVNRILTANDWNFFFWVQMPHVVRIYSFVKQEQVSSAHGNDIERLVRDLTNAPWMTSEHKSGLNDFFEQIKGNYETEAQLIKREVHENDLNIVRRNIGRLDSVLEAVAKVELEAAEGTLGQASLSAPQSPYPIPAASPAGPPPADAGSTQTTSSDSLSVVGRWRRTMDGYTVDVREATPGQYEGVTVDAGGASHLYSAGETILKLTQASDGTYAGTIKVKLFSRGEENWAPARQQVLGNKMTGYGDWIRSASPAAVTAPSVPIQPVSQSSPTQIAATPAAAVGPQDNPMLHQDGRMIVDGNGQPVKLRGILIEGWLMWNGTLWGAGLHSEKTMYEKMVNLVGEEDASRFRQAVYDSFFTEEDVRLMAAMGFNVLRVPFNHRILEDDTNPYVYKESGWKLLDQSLEWCERHGLYVVLDLHSAPGGQSGVFVADPDKDLLWDSEENKKRTVALWKAIATRYRDRPVVAGYDLLNEPAPRNKDDLVEIYKRITAAIREVDPQHMVILEGSDLAADFSMFEKLPEQPVANMTYSFHTYNFITNSVDKKQAEKMKKLSDQHQTPIWNSEFGAHTTDWVRGQVDLYEAPEYGMSGWVYWPWKRVPENDKNRWGVLFEISPTPNWKKTSTWMASIFGFLGKPSREEALKGMCEFIQKSAPRNLEINAEMATSLRMNPARNARQPDTLASVLAMCAENPTPGSAPVPETVDAAPLTSPSASGPESPEVVMGDEIPEDFEQDVQYTAGNFFWNITADVGEARRQIQTHFDEKDGHEMKCQILGSESNHSLQCRVMENPAKAVPTHPTTGMNITLSSYRPEQSLYPFRHNFASHRDADALMPYDYKLFVNLDFKKQADGESTRVSVKASDRVYNDPKKRDSLWDKARWDNTQASFCVLSAHLNKQESTVRGTFRCHRLWSNSSIDTSPNEGFREWGPVFAKGSFYVPCEGCNN